MRPVRYLSVAFVLAVLVLSLVPSAAPQQYRLAYLPLLRTSSSEEVRISLTNPGVDPATVVLTARGYDGSLMDGPGIVNPVSLTLGPSNSRALTAREVFGGAVSAGWVELKTLSPALSGAFFVSDSNLPSLDGAELAAPSNRLIFPRGTTDTSLVNRLALANTTGHRIASLAISFYENSGRLVTKRTLALPAYSGFCGSVLELIPDFPAPFEGYAVAEASGSGSLIGAETYRKGADIAMMAALPPSARGRTGYAVPPALLTASAATLAVINYGPDPQTVNATAAIVDTKSKNPNATIKTVQRTLSPGERWEGQLDQVFGFSVDRSAAGYVRYDTTGNSNGVFAYLESSALDGSALAAAPVVPSAYSDIAFPSMADSSAMSTALTLMNPGLGETSITLDARSPQGFSLDSTTLTLAPNGRWSGPLTELLPATAGQVGGSVKITASSLILAAQILTLNGSGAAIANVPGQWNASSIQGSGQAVSAALGGTVLSPDSSVSLYVPPGALSQDTPIQITPLNAADFPKPKGGERVIGMVEGTPSGTHFRIPARLRFPLSERAQPGSVLSVYIFNPGTGEYEPSEFLATVDSSGRSASAEVTHFTQFAVAAGVQSVQISNVSPNGAPIGGVVAINGSGFGLLPADNSVYFAKPGGNSFKATVLTASSNRLTVAVPSGATSGKVYVQVGSVKSNSVVFKVIASVNQAPAVDAGPDQSSTLPEGVVLSGIVADDGLPSGALVTSLWTQVSGPGLVTFGDPSSPSTPATFSTPGVYTLRLAANDSALTGSSDVTITVSLAPPDNQTPQVDAGPDGTVAVSSPYGLLGTATDDGLPSGQLSASWAKVSGPGTVVFEDPGSFTGIATFSAVGAYTLRLTASDGVLTSSDEVVVTVTPAPVNQPPVTNAGPDKSITLPANTSLSGSATDDNLPAGVLIAAWTRVSGPGTVTFSSPSSFATNADFSVAGTYALRLTVSDSALSSTDDVVITVAPAPPNQAPVANAGSDQSITLPASANLAGSATDDNLPNGTLTAGWTKLSGPGVVTFGAPNAFVTTAAFSVAGAYTLRLTAGDGALSSTDDVVVNVSPLNHSPVVNAGPDVSLTMPSMANLWGSATDDGLPNGTLTVAWSKVSGPGTVTFGAPGTFVTTATFSAAGTYTLRLTANDGSLTSTDDVVVVASPLNQPPIVSAGPDKTVALPAAANLAGSATDDGLPIATLTLAWTKVSGPGTVTFASPSAPATTATFSAAGTYTLRLTANDGALLANDDVVVIAAPANQQPTANAGPDQTISLPATATLAGSASDDGLPSNTLTVAWTKISGPGAVTFASPLTLVTTASFSVAGSYTVRLTASDGALSSSDDLVVVVSAPVNRAPSVSAGADLGCTLPSTVTLSGTATDDGLPSGAMTVSWSKVSGPGNVVFVAPTALLTTASFSAAGNYTLRLTANDGALSASDDVVVVVNPPIVNQAPGVNAGSDQTVAFGTTVALSGSVIDDGLPQGSALTSQWSKVSGPGTTTFLSATALNTTVTFSAAGTYVLRLTATDGVLSGSDDVTINANVVGGNSPIVDAGPVKSIAFPAKHLTLFGHASDPDNDNLILQWTQTGGPAPVTFSGAASATTTVLFSAPGTYGFQLSASDGLHVSTHSTIVFVFTETSQTAFYVDPTYASSTGDGSASRPWRSLGSSAGSAQWNAINSALASNNVVVYFSARQAASDTPEVERNSVNIYRTDTGTNRLTMDGMSKYNANDTAPSWSDYTGDSRFQISMTAGALSIGIGSDQTAFPMHYTTIRGFDLTGAGARLSFAGNYTVVEFVRLHDITGLDPTILFHSAVYPNCARSFGNLRDITIRGIVIERGMGEGIYINGNYIHASDGGCPSWGNTHSDILIEGNTIIDPGKNGGQGDGIDLKAGLTNVTIRGNTIRHTDAGVRAATQSAKGIVSSGVFNSATTPSNFLVENNLLINTPLGIVLSYVNNATIRNNVVANTTGSGIAGGISTSYNDEPTPMNFNLNIYNNTIFNGGIGLLSVNTARVRNNLIAGYVSQHGGCVNVNSDYNGLINGAFDNWGEGSHTLSMTSATPVFVNAAGFDFHLVAGAPPIKAGVALDPVFPDFDKVARPAGAQWDMGAFKY
ncbi:MAG TPA: hypothetical protein VFY29_05375 [Terriglobia bacterium]|nr:hypothetical protein [Terriglobia bacterium]